jgi:hypothetical protein
MLFSASLRNKASNLNAHLMKDHIIDIHCGLDFEGNVSVFLKYLKYTQQRNVLLQQFRAKGVPFQEASTSEYSLNYFLCSQLH